MGAPSLSLNALSPSRETVEIITALHPEGRLYEMRRGDELSIEMLTEITALGAQAEALAEKALNPTTGEVDLDLVSPGEGKLLDDWTKRMLELVFHTPLEDEVYAALSQDQRLQVMELFTKTSLQNRAQRRSTSTGTRSRKKNPTGVK